jgi:hypothetical protein
MLVLKITHKAPKKNPTEIQPMLNHGPESKPLRKSERLEEGNMERLRNFPMGNRACLGPFFHLIKSPHKRT